MNSCMIIKAELHKQGLLNPNIDWLKYKGFVMNGKGLVQISTFYTKFPWNGGHGDL